VKESYSVPFGYEEAIGFMLNTGIRDKDGVAATVSMAENHSILLTRIQVFFAEMAAWLDSRCSSAAAFLNELYEKYVIESSSSLSAITQNLLEFC
jgi:phosphomannomutase